VASHDSCMMTEQTVPEVPLSDVTGTHAARMDSPVAVLSAIMTRWSYVSSAYWLVVLVLCSLLAVLAVFEESSNIMPLIIGLILI